MNPLKQITVALLALLIVACTALPTQQESIAHYINQQKSTARTLEAEGRLADALSMWRSLLPLGSPDEETALAINKLEAEIKAGVKTSIRSAEAAYRRGDVQQGDTWMLRVLALQPGQGDALARLGKSASTRAQAQQNDKSSGEYQAIVERQRKAPGSVNQRLRSLYQQGDYTAMLALGKTAGDKPGQDVAQLLRSAHLALADQSQQAGELEASLDHLQSAMTLHPLENDPLLARTAGMRKELSDDWYKQGSQLMKSELPQAIVALEKSLSYNPYNSAAKRKLAQAQTLQRNLERIKGSH